MKFCKDSLVNLERTSVEYDRADYMRLDMNENPDGINADFFESVIKNLKPTDVSTYPNTNRLKRKLASLHGVAPENIVITNGSDCAIKYTFESMCEVGDKIILPTPTFAMYEVYCKMYGLEIIPIEYNSDMTFPFENLYNSIVDGIRIVVTLNPNNPIGSVFSDDEIKKIVVRAKGVGAFVIIDEAYHYFYPKTFDYLVKEYDNVILYRTFSKLCALAGCRIGYALANPETINSIIKVKPTFDANSIALIFAEKLLDSGLINQFVNVEKDGKKHIVSRLKENNIAYRLDNGNYLFIECGDKTEQIAEKLKERKVLVKTYSYEALKNHIRITTACKNTMEKFFNIFIDIYNSIKEEK